MTIPAVEIVEQPLVKKSYLPTGGGVGGGVGGGLVSSTHFAEASL
jgi:hypothetical protein